jgi:GNAT superfamily N-acetyltransferase
MGVALCSGFGMTEATGGITMTPPDRYIENSTGIPLPGVKTRLNILGELEISGHYIARYLDDAGPGDIIPYPENDSNDNWLSTGDVFTIDSDGFHEIVDRVKDIYKNNKGQTVAPRTVEQKFVNVPGINATFLVGDGRPYNVLLIVPDFNDPILAALDDENRNEYFHQIVMAANNQLAPYERVINFTLLDRAFSAEMGELTPKNSYNRKAIEQNFAELIRQLYRSDIIRLEVNNMIVQIPRWFYRDLGILEDDILPIENGLRNKRNATELKIERKTDSIFLIGNLRYFNDSDVIDLGLLARQPRIWIGNPELMKFCPIKEGWDVPLKPGHDRVMIDNEQQISIDALEVINIKGSRDIQLNLVNKLVCETLFSSPSKAKTHLLKLGEIFSTCDKRMADTVRRRIEAMAYHKSESLRVTAYRVLLLNDPDPDFSKSFPAFIRSGLPFLNEASIKLIAESNLGRKHLDALRRRLYAYRIRFDETVDQPYRNQFIDLLKLLFNYARINLNYYSVIRSELANWVLFKKDKVISDRARFYIYELEKVYDQQLIKENAFNSVKEWKQKIVFENVIAKKEQEKLLQIFSSTFIVNKSIKLIYNENRFTFDEISEKGLWVVKMPVFKEYMHYRLSINTVSGKHFDIHLVKTETAKRMTTPETVFWHAAIAGHPYGEFVLPQLGCSNDNLGILTTQYISGLTLWDKIREFSEVNESIIPANKSRIWRKKFIMAFTAIIKAWKTSGYSIIPGSIAPNNSVVPETDFRDQSVILSLSGFKSYKNTISLLEPMIHNFYLKTAALYPRTKRLLQTEWIFDSFMEALGEDEAGKRYIQMKTDLRNHKIETLDGNDPVILLDKYIELRKQSRYYPIAVYNAVDRYAEWLALNPRAKVSSKEQTIFELIELFQLQKHPAIIRFYLYRYTYFSNAEPDIINTFDRLLQKMEQNTATPPVHLIELSDLQSALTNKDDKSVFAGMVFPTIRNEQKMDILRVTGKNKDAVIVRSVLTDKHQVTYKFRNPISASEVGSLYNLFFKENYPKEISDADRHIVLVDIHDRIIGGLCYKNLDEGMVLLDGIVVISSLQGRGLGSLMMEDFFTRMESSGAKIVKAHFLLGNFYLKHHFKVDEHRGALVREI